ncbi:MAG: diguanylate cyclase [Anaerolineae bacterium]|nr:diguanylate cyclase [Anaerolineae bacterium]
MIRRALLILAGGMILWLGGWSINRALANTSADPGTLTDTFRFERLTVEDGLPNATVLSALQDRQGFMWFATADGLSRYDGYNFTTFRHDPTKNNSISNNNLFALIESRDGLIWIGTDPGGVNVYDPETGLFSVYRHDENSPQSLVDDSVWSLMEDNDGNIWVGTRNGVSRLDRKTGLFKNYVNDPDNPHSLAAGVIYRIYQDRQGTIWLGTDSGLHKYYPQTDDFTIFQNNPDDPQSISNDYVWGLLEDSQGVFWVATHGGLNKLDRKSGKFSVFHHDPQDIHSLSDDRLWSIYEDSSNRLWITTENGGLNLFDRQTQTFTSFLNNPNKPESISNNDVYWITESEAGVLWITSRYGGVNKLYPALSRFGIYRSIPGDDNSLSSNSVYSILPESNNVVWIGTFGGGLNRLDRSTGENKIYKNDPNDPDSLESDKIYYVHRDESGVLWLATAGGGLNRMDPQTGKFKAFHYTSDAPNVIGSNYLTTIESAGDDRLWVGTLGYGLDLFNTEKEEMDHEYFHHDDDPNSLSEDTVYDVAVDKNGLVWVATARGGLESLDPKTGIFSHNRYQADNPNSILSDSVFSVYYDASRDVIWAGTSGGLSGFDMGSREWKNYTTHDGLPNDNITAVQPGSAGELWLSTSKGISRFDPDKGTFHNYDARDGLQGDQFVIASSQRGPDGELFFGGSNGVTFFKPDSIVNNSFLAPVIFTDFELFNQSVPVGSQLLPQPIEKMNRIILNYDQSVFTLKYAALSYQISSKNLYQHKLEGFDKDWSPAMSRQDVTYTNLSPGNYTLLVRAANNDGIWNNVPARLEIEVLPPWWETWWFRLIAVLTIIMATVGGFQYRFKKMETDKRELEKRVGERTIELQEAQERLQLVNEELQQQINEITSLEQALREQAIHDGLTGLYNRHYLSEIMDIELNRAQRGQHSLAFLLMDLDHFKQINDTYGHLAGDYALKITAETVAAHTRRGDIVFRYGGEEFMVFMPDINLDDVIQRANYICNLINQLQIVFDNRQIHVTASIGVAVFPLHGNSGDEILSRADVALYQAKRSGRNRVVVYQPGMENETLD